MMPPAPSDSPILTRVSVRPTSDDRALVSVTLPTVRLAGLWARRSVDGRVKLQAPRTGAHDEFPAYALQPGFAELVAEAVAVLWARADADREAEAALIRPRRAH